MLATSEVARTDARPLRSRPVQELAAASMWFFTIGIIMLLPALIHGSKLGSYDLLAVFGLGHRAGTPPHNIVDADQIQQFMPWTTQAWTQVHQGHLPLWNPLSGIGLPLAFNFQSAPFSVTALVGYLLPVRFAFDVAIILKMLIGATGAYSFCRVAGGGAIGAVFAGTTYELSGAFAAWEGWPQSGVMAWAPWILAAVTMVLSESRRARNVLLLALVVAFSVYGGHPESTMIVTLGTLAYVVGFVASQDGRRKHLRRKLIDVLLGFTAGFGLSAPLLLPGAQLIPLTARRNGAGSASLPARNLVHLAFQGFDGLPVAGGHYVGIFSYYDVSSYVGVLALSLALLGGLARRRSAPVVGLVTIGALAAALLYVSPFLKIVALIPGAGGVLWYREQMLLDMSLAVLAGLGLDVIVRRGTEPGTVKMLGVIVASAGAGLAALALWEATAAHLTPDVASTRAHSFLWQTAQWAALAIMFAFVALRRRHSPTAGQAGSGAQVRGLQATALALVIVEGIFLAASGSPLWSSDPQSFAVTPAERALQAAVGSARVGFGTCPSLGEVPDLGILPEANVAYGVAEFAVYDPIIPLAYYQAWGEAIGQPNLKPLVGKFCPAITSVRLAREFGVQYILEPPGVAGPLGTSRVATVGDEGVYAVPGSSTFSTVDEDSTADSGAVAQTKQPSPSSFTAEVTVQVPSTLHIHVANVPGWRATIDGRPLPLRSWHGIMMQASIPTGHHRVVLRYWPPAFTAGLVVAAVSLASLLAALAISRRRRTAGARSELPAH